MIRTDELRGLIAKNGYTQSAIAAKIGITPKTFYEKMKNGVFGSDEIQIMIDELNIEDPVAIFFCQRVTYKDTTKNRYHMEMLKARTEKGNNFSSP